MTGYESKRAAAQDRMIDDDDTQVYQQAHDLATYGTSWTQGGKRIDPMSVYAQPAQAEQCKYPDCKCPTENPCLKGLAQPAQEPMKFAGIQMRVGDKQVQVFLTQMEFHRAEDPWALMAHKAAMCISKLKEMNNGT